MIGQEEEAGLGGVVQGNTGLESSDLCSFSGHGSVMKTFTVGGWGGGWGGHSTAGTRECRRR